MNITTVKTLLGITNVNNVSINSWTGSSNLTVLGTLNNLNVGFLNMSLNTLTAVGSNSSVNISATGTGIINATSTLRLSNGITSTGTLTITANGGASPVEIWGPLDMKTNSVSNVGSINGLTLPSSNFVGINDAQTLSNKSFSSNITISTGALATTLILNGTSTSTYRTIQFQNNGTRLIEMGLSGTTYWFIYDVNLGLDVLRLTLGGGNSVRFPTYTTNGTLSVTGGIGTVSSSSDRRLKQDEEALNPSVSLQKIMNLQPKKFKWISTPDVEEIGFIAQDVETVIPEAIDGKKFAYEFFRDGATQDNEGVIRVDENGMPVMDENRPRYRGLNQCAILSTLVSAFQASIEKINALEARINELDH